MVSKQVAHQRSHDLRRTLAHNLRLYRQKSGLSQEAFADICGLHRTYVGSVERCERNVTLATLSVFASALEVTVPELLIGKAKRNGAIR